MFYQVFEAYCRSAQLMMLIQQEIFRQWINQWSMAPADRKPRPEVSPEVRDKHREVLDPAYKSGIKAIEAASRTTEAASRITEAATSPRRHGNGDVLVAPDAPDLRADEGATIQLHAEELHAHKQFVEAGEVRVRKEVVTERRTLEVPVRREEIVIERHAPAGARISANDIGPGQEIRIPLREERVTVEKRPVVTEEVTVGKRVIQDTERVGGEVRKEEVRVVQHGDVDIHDRDTATSPT